MKIGIISDIHSNSEALKSVVQALHREDVYHIINAGDNVGYSANPNTCIEIIRMEGFYNVMGNYDDAVAYDRKDCGCRDGNAETRHMRMVSLYWTQKSISIDNKRYLSSLPHLLNLIIGEKNIFAVHGGLNRLNEFIYEEDDDALEEIAEEYTNADIVILGHTHKPFIRRINGKIFINPGSIGKPVDGDYRPSFVVADLSNDIHAEIRRVEYDVEKNVNNLIDAGLPQEIGDQIRNAMETTETLNPYPAR
jgi:putative phosphoesterase